MYPCRNHPHQPATRGCSHCQQPFCDGCLVDFMGHPHCGPCRDLRLQWMQRPVVPAQKNPHHELREKVLVGAVVLFAVGSFLLNLGLMVPAAVVGVLLFLTLMGALVLHMLGSR